MSEFPFSRRDFLKVSAAGFLGAFLADLGMGRALAAPGPSQGRMVSSGIALYEHAYFNAKKLHVFGRDEIVPITAHLQGDAGNPSNNTWYCINDEGFTYSGWVQPVQTDYQPPVFQVHPA
ncbi:MAG TPA: hypothetical protein VMJ64_13925, partial [Anaerolineales bacterium]|nr:hypothetical protein [Anaerolineales bacterium]